MSHFIYNRQRQPASASVRCRNHIVNKNNTWLLRAGILARSNTSSSLRPYDQKDNLLIIQFLGRITGKAASEQLRLHSAGRRRWKDVLSQSSALNHWVEYTKIARKVAGCAEWVERLWEHVLAHPCAVVRHMRGKGREHFGGPGQRGIYFCFHINHLLSFFHSASFCFLELK